MQEGPRASPLPLPFWSRRESAIELSTPAWGPSGPGGLSNAWETREEAAQQGGPEESPVPLGAGVRAGEGPQPASRTGTELRLWSQAAEALWAPLPDLENGTMTTLCFRLSRPLGTAGPAAGSYSWVFPGAGPHLAFLGPEDVNDHGTLKTVTAGDVRDRLGAPQPPGSLPREHSMEAQHGGPARRPSGGGPGLGSSQSPPTWGLASRPCGDRASAERCACLLSFFRDAATEVPPGPSFPR